ncbi:primosomal protein N' [Collinsella sp. zg1085]|uniref:replication restart helicase PriA n=1 Tax=Collinsella sp. zg1085 TaxID=2844380 RepID=UPI001C0B83B7|nr:primosomal protein N' [Collinsella sp. zg1085]QWT17145.1 primosomal protein N' [Collinsella sp. zg1085]
MTHIAPTQTNLFDEAALAKTDIDAQGSDSPEHAQPSCTHQRYSLFASVVLDIPTRALADSFAYGVPDAIAKSVHIGCTVLVRFGGRLAVGYVIAVNAELKALSGAEHLQHTKIQPLISVLSPPRFSETSAHLAVWMSHEYVATLLECLRLFLPPGTTPKLKKNAEGNYELIQAQTKALEERWVSLTARGFAFEPRNSATRQRQLVDALRSGPLTTRELRVLYTDMSSAIRALEKKGIVHIEKRRSWRGGEYDTSLSSAQAHVPGQLTEGQLNALAAIEDVRQHQRDDVIVIDGVTGSGKTEVYLSAIAAVIAEGKSACVLVPEISLTAQTVGRFRSRFGSMVAVFHSRLSAGERLDQWDMVHSGAARVVVGARSALFCPLQNLGLIIIDEEHEQSYKQGSAPRYHAREVAAELAKTHKIPLVLGSATPSAEAQERCLQGQFGGQTWLRVAMPERPGRSALPQIHMVDLRKEFRLGARSIFSKQLAEALLEVVSRGEKAVLLHNRRGFAPFLMCRECGCVPSCPHCSTSLTYHERTHALMCHTCGTSYRVRPYPAMGSACPQCHSRYLAKMGIGTQQVEDELRQLLPADVAIIRMDADTTKTKDAHKELLEAFDAAPTAVLLGTQMIAKGLDFPEVTLVGVVMADYALKMPDFRAQERAYSLLEQVAGRAGRGEMPGQVIIQTYLPEEAVMRAVFRHDRTIFTKHDADMRRSALYPPYVRLTNVVLWGAQEARVRAAAERLAGLVRAVLSETKSEHSQNLPQLLGPVPCALARVKDRFRFHFMLKTPLGYDVSRVVRHALTTFGTVPDIHVSVDVDAYDVS